MFGSTTALRGSFEGPSLISKRTARRSAQNAYDTSLANAADDRQTAVGRGMGAGSGRNAFALNNQQQMGQVQANNAYNNEYMAATEANREARLQAQRAQFAEAQAMSNLATDLDQSRFVDEFSRASTLQDINSANRNYSTSMLGKALGPALDIFSGIMDSTNKRGRNSGLLGRLL